MRISTSLIVVFSVLISCVNPESESVSDNFHIVKNSNEMLLAEFSRGDIALMYEATTAEMITHSKLTVERAGNPGIRVELNFTIDTKEDAYKLIQHERIIVEANKVTREFAKHKFNKDQLSKLFEVFSKLIINNENVDYTSQLSQSLFFHNSILNSIKRSEQTSQECNCTPHPAYFGDKSPFWCQEDYYVNPNKLIEAVDNSNLKLTEKEKEVYSFLVSKRNLDAISYDQITRISVPQFSVKVSDYYKGIKLDNDISGRTSAACSSCWWEICGNQLGCCGNYSGCCVLATLDCLWHDIECLNCDKWHCGWACVPGAA